MTPSRRAAETANMSTAIVLDPSAFMAQSMRYLGQVRWSKAGVLQQAVEVTTYGPPGGPESVVEWRDVPTEGDA